MERSTKTIHQWVVRKATRSGGTLCGIVSTQTTVADHEVTCEDCLAKLTINAIKLKRYFRGD